MGSGDPPGLQNRRAAPARCRGWVRLPLASAICFQSFAKSAVDHLVLVDLKFGAQLAHIKVDSTVALIPKRRF
jgi:hypothetical protein